MRRRVSGRFAGEFAEDGGEPEEVNAPVEIEADPVAGVVRTRIRDSADEIRSHRAAMAVSYLQGQLRREERRERHARRPIRPVPKPIGTRTARGGVPAGFTLCPACSIGLADPWDCARCEGRGIVRADDNA